MSIIAETTSRGPLVAVSPDGPSCMTPPGALGRDLVYIVQTAAGQETLTPAEMEAKYGWKNDPDKVRLVK